MALSRWAKAVGVAVVVAPVALVMSEAVSAAPSASRNAVGQVSCSFSSGVVKLNPGRRPPSGGPETIKGKLNATTGSSNACSGSVTVGGIPVKVIGARVSQEVVVDFLEGDPDRPLVVGQVYNAKIQWELSPAKPKIARTNFSYTGGSWTPPTATVPPSGGSLVRVSGSFGGSGATINISLNAPGLFTPTVPPRRTTVPILGGSISVVDGSCLPFGC